MKFKKWITNGTTAPFYARKQFSVTKKVKHASAKVCGLGQFIFYLNGKKVGDHELDPGWTNYKKLIQYVTFNVTDNLRQGENVLGAEVGNGWFIKTDENYTFAFPSFMPPNPNPYQPYGKSLVLALGLVITYADGTQETIMADESFRTKEHPIVMSNVYGSETYDGGLEQFGWTKADFDDSDWMTAQVVAEADEPKGKLVEQFQPAVKVIRTYKGRLVGTFNGRDIYDFGQNVSGILELEFCGNTADMIKIYPAEKLGADGDADQMAKGWMPVDSCITCIAGKNGEWESYRMKFTYFAGRFAAVEKGAVKIRNLKAHAITSAWAANGSFTCDDERYNRIYDMIEKTVEANMVSVHTDCPTIERFAWQEPNHLMAPSIFYMKDGSKLWEKFLLDIRVEQHTAEDRFRDFSGNEFCPGDGLVPSQAPCYIPNVLPVPGMGSFYDIIPWGSTSILGVYWHYQFYGDRKVIEDNYDSGMRYLHHLKTKVNADVTVLAMFAGILGKSEDQAELEAYAEGIKKNYNEKMLSGHFDTRWRGTRRLSAAR